jgi:hypothetical protein
MKPKVARQAMHHVNMMRLHAFFDRGGPEGILTMGATNHFGALKKRVRHKIVSLLDIELERIQVRRDSGKYRLPKTAHRAIEQGFWYDTMPEAKRVRKAWVKATRIALDATRDTLAVIADSVSDERNI